MVNGRVRHAEHWLAFRRTHDLSVWGKSQRLNSIASFVTILHIYLQVSLTILHIYLQVSLTILQSYIYLYKCLWQSYIYIYKCLWQSCNPTYIFTSVSEKKRTNCSCWPKQWNGQIMPFHTLKELLVKRLKSLDHILLLRYDLAKMSTIALNRFWSVGGGQYGSKFGQVHLWVGRTVQLFSAPSNTLHDLFDSL